MKTDKDLDDFLKKRVVKYDEWMEKGKIAYSSKVIPVKESFDAKQWVISTEQAMHILKDATTVAVQECECRTHYQRCDHPLEVCFLLNMVADRYVSKERARYVFLTEAEEILKKANESGLVHLALYMPDHQVFALCSCCSCCCHDLQLVKQFGRKDIMVRSEYVATVDDDACVHCGDCIERCVFDARTMLDERMVYDEKACMGCGLCVTSCPVDAVSMALLHP